MNWHQKGHNSCLTTMWHPILFNKVVIDYFNADTKSNLYSWRIHSLFPRTNNVNERREVNQRFYKVQREGGLTHFLDFFRRLSLSLCCLISLSSFLSKHTHKPRRASRRLEFYDGTRWKEHMNNDDEYGWPACTGIIWISSEGWCGMNACYCYTNTSW